MKTIILQSRTLEKDHLSPINTSDVRLRASAVISTSGQSLKHNVRSSSVAVEGKLLLGFYVKIELRLLFPFGRTAMLKNIKCPTPVCPRTC